MMGDGERGEQEGHVPASPSAHPAIDEQPGAIFIGGWGEISQDSLGIQSPPRRNPVTVSALLTYPSPPFTTATHTQNTSIHIYT